MTSKRKRQTVEDGNDTANENEELPTSKKLRSVQASRSNSREPDAPHPGTEVPETPSKRRRGRPPGSGSKPKLGLNDSIQRSNYGTPKSKLQGKVLFATPTKPRREDDGEGTVPLVRNADRSARRKSARTLIQRTTTDDLSDENEGEEENTLATRIWDADEHEDSDTQNDVEDDLVVDDVTPTTPSKRISTQRKNARRKRTPTPPQDLPPHEQYFLQTRPGKAKTSNNTLSSLSLLSHEQYHQQITAYDDPHASSFAFLHSLHSRSFPQWHFELSQSFSICLYGYGSKRRLLTSFADYLHPLHPPSSPPQILIINGYIPTLTLRQVLTTLATLVFSCAASSLPTNIGTQPHSMLSTILAYLRTSPPPIPIYLFINSLDAPPLRRAPAPSILAQLSTSPHIRLLATCDSPSFPLLWDSNLRDQYNWLFHDTTTFESYAPVEVGNAIDDVNELMGRSGRTVKGKEGVGFVLRSLPENARNLYRVLVAEVLAAMDEGNEDDQGQGEEGELRDENGRFKPGRDKAGGVEYRVLYQKVVEEFICSSEMAFRQLLKEFHDHQMVVSKRDGAGTEMLGVPFRREEMEAILEDIM